MEPAEIIAAITAGAQVINQLASLLSQVHVGKTPTQADFDAAKAAWNDMVAKSDSLLK